METATTSCELHEQIARYHSLRRTTLDKRTLEALADLTAEAQEQLRRLENSPRVGC